MMNNYDKIEIFHNAKIQYGPMNDRIYLMKIGDGDITQLLSALDNLAQENNFGKIFAKTKACHRPAFVDAGYAIEATIPNFYNGQEDGIFLGKYFKDERSIALNAKELDTNLALAKSKAHNKKKIELADGFEFRRATIEDAEQISEVYQQVFASYPFPIHQSDYICQTMKDDVYYFSIWENDKLVALSSAEVDKENGNAEMTDFATLPDYRGHSFGVFLLDKMEQEMAKMAIPTVYTIARAISPGMNITFAKMGYHYGGRLINNTQISGSLESMNIWYKSI